ncbi:MAG: flagellin [Methylovulum sp.]|nr:MAG: flagellin [Methylovulum sp.]
MTSIVNTNISSLNAQRNLGKSQMTQQTAMQRLSSGLRINSAKDDAAGLSIADRMTSQIKGLNQATRNANDGISLAQTAEGALGEITNSLQRLRELSVQSANATNTTGDRAAIQQEADQLLQEIDRVAGQTEFNGTKLLDGTFKNQSFQIGANAGQTIAIGMTSSKTDTLGTGDASSITGRASASIAGDSTTPPSMVAGDVSINGVTIGASVATADNKSFSFNSASAIAKTAAFNESSAQTGVTATVNATEVEGRAMTGAATDGVIVINGVSTSAVFTTTDTSATRQSVITAINSVSDQTGVTAVDTGTDAAGVKLTAVDGRNITIGFDNSASTTAMTAASTGLAFNGTDLTTPTDKADAGYQTYFGTYTLSSSKDINIDESTGSIGNTGLQAGTYSPQVAYTSTTELATNTAFAAGDFKINGVLVGATLASDDKASSALKDNSAISKAAAINSISAQTSVTAKVNTNTTDGTVATAGATGVININGVNTGSITTSGTDFAADRAAVVQAINAISGQTGVLAVDTNDNTKGIKLQAADGRNIVVDAATGGFAGDGSDNGLVADGTYTGSVTLSSATSFKIESGTTGTDVTTTLGLEVGTYGAGKSGQALNTIDLTTAEGATAALTAIDNALASVNSSRGTLGAVQNRFTSTISSLQTTSENLTSARSRIQDADFAAESAELSRSQILQQAGTAMLAQANTASQGVLSLLR